MSYSATLVSRQLSKKIGCILDSSDNSAVVLFSWIAVNTTIALNLELYFLYFIIKIPTIVRIKLERLETLLCEIQQICFPTQY